MLTNTNVLTTEYSKDIVHSLLGLHGVANISFRYDITDQNGTFINSIDVSDGEISYNADADIKRKASLTIKNSKDINYIKDRIRPYFVLKYFDTLEKKHKQEEWLLGTFIMSDPEESRYTNGLGCYDYDMILREGGLKEPFLIQNGEVFVVAFEKFLNSIGFIATDVEYSSIKSANRDILFRIGHSYKEICSFFAQTLNHESIRFNEYGVPVSRKYVSVFDRSVEFNYSSNRFSAYKVGASKSTLLQEVPNVFVSRSTNSETEEIFETVLVNDSPTSEVSTINRGWNKVIEYEYTDIDSLEELKNRNLQNYNQYTSIYQKISFTSALIPFHGHANVLFMDDKEMGIFGNYNEREWVLPLTPGGEMTHNCRKSVGI